MSQILTFATNALEVASFLSFAFSRHGYFGINYQNDMAPNTPAVSGKIKFIVKILAPLRPGESPPSTPSRMPAKPLATFSIAANASDKFSDVSRRILEVWKQNYSSIKTDESYFVKLQGIHGDDINLPDPVGDLYDPTMPQNERTLFVVTHALDRDCTIPPWSRLRVGDQSQRKRTVEEDERLDRRKRQKIRYGTTVDALRPDEPLETREDLNGHGREEDEGEAEAGDLSPPATPRQVRAEPASQESVLIEDSQAAGEGTVAPTAPKLHLVRHSPPRAGKLRRPATASTTYQWDLTNGRDVPTAGLEMRGLATTSAERLARTRKELPTPITPDDPISSYDPPESAQRPNRTRPFGRQPARAPIERRGTVSTESNVLLEDPINDDELLNALGDHLPQQRNNVEDPNISATLPHPEILISTIDQNPTTPADSAAPRIERSVSVRSNNAFDVLRSSQSTTSTYHPRKSSSSHWSEEENKKLIEGSLEGLSIREILRKYNLNRSESGARNHRLFLEKYDTTLTEDMKITLKALRLPPKGAGSKLKSSPFAASRSSPATQPAPSASVARSATSLAARNRNTLTPEQVEQEPQPTTEEQTGVARTNAVEVPPDINASGDLVTFEQNEVRIRRSPEVIIESSEQNRALSSFISESNAIIDSGETTRVEEGPSINGNGNGQTVLKFPRDKRKGVLRPERESTAELDAKYGRTSFRNSTTRSGSANNGPSRVPSHIGDVVSDPMMISSDDDDDDDSLYTSSVVSKSDVTGAVRNESSRGDASHPEVFTRDEEIPETGAEGATMSDDGYDAFAVGQPPKDTAETHANAAANGKEEANSRPLSPEPAATQPSIRERTGSLAQPSLRRNILQTTPSTATVKRPRPDPYDFGASLRPRHDRTAGSTLRPEPALSYNERMSIARQAISDGTENVNEDTSIPTKQSTPEIGIDRILGANTLDRLPRRRPPTAQQLIAEGGPGMIPAGQPGVFDRSDEVIYKEVQQTLGVGAPKAELQQAFEAALHHNRMLSAIGRGDHAEVERLRQRKAQIDREVGHSRRTLTQPSPPAQVANGEESADEEIVRNDIVPNRVSTPKDVSESDSSEQDNVKQDTSEDEESDQDSSKDESDHVTSDEEGDQDSSDEDVAEHDNGKETRDDEERLAAQLNQEPVGLPQEDHPVEDTADDENDTFQSAFSSPMPDDEKEDVELPTRPPSTKLRAPPKYQGLVRDADLQQLVQSGDERNENDTGPTSSEDPGSEPPASKEQLPTETTDEASICPTTAAKQETNAVHHLDFTISDSAAITSRGQTEDATQLKVRKKQNKRERGYRKKTTKLFPSEAVVPQPDAVQTPDLHRKGQTVHPPRTESSASFRSSIGDDKRRRRRRVHAASIFHTSSPAQRLGTPTAPSAKQSDSLQPNPQMPTPGFHRTEQVVMSVATPTATTLAPASDNSAREKTLKERLTFRAHIPSPPRAKPNGSGSTHSTVKPGPSFFGGATDDDESSESSESSSD